MKPAFFVPLPFLLPPLFLLLLLPSSLSADYHYLQNCQPKSCGSLVNVSFPFWIRGLQPDYCGYPPFELRCEDDTPRLFMAEDDYQVLNISYEQSTATVSMSKFTGLNSCLLPYYNLSFALSPFAISELNRELVFLYNCSASNNGAMAIVCHDNRSSVYLGGEYEAREGKGMLGPCFSAVMPVLSSVGAEVKEYQKLLSSGFLLNWTAPDCSECTMSGGQCGYNNDTRNFMCICPDRAHWKSCSEGGSNSALIIGLSTGAGGLCFIVFCCLCLLLYKFWKRKQRSSSKLFGRSTSFTLSKTGYELGSSFSSPIFTYDELYKATNGFDASKELGDGGFGTVYKGKLKDGRVVAVKRLYENNFRRLEQFMNEVKILSHLRHQNLVTLYGCTSRRSRELLLVYEFISNGTVADHLHGPRATESPLSWRVRMGVAIETADALNYLHSVEPQIIHRDVKTTNILLDDSFHVKVADFGLSRLFPADATHVSTSPQGTPGYVDPEYHQSYQLTDKSDVYSFGVVLMELISSKPAVDIGRERNEVNLANLALRMMQREQLPEFVDKGLGYDSDHRTKGMITEVAGLGLRCLQPERELRPGIKEVAEVLRGIEENGLRDDSEHMEVDVPVTQEEVLLKKVPPRSPNSVTDRWLSLSSSLSSFNS